MHKQVLRETMAKEGQEPDRSSCEALARRRCIGKAAAKGPPPVHLWNPPFCGDIDMRIAADGTWFYQKTPIGRPALVKLFASMLKREGDRYFLVTPVEKCGIAVDDAPFLAVELKVETGRRPAASCISHQCRRLGRLRARSIRCGSSRSRRPAASGPICMCAATCGPR